MEELNNTHSVDVITADKFDALTVTDMGSAIGLSQMDEDGKLHDVIIGREQALALIARLGAILSEAH